jgi:hypothetical protein
MSDKAKVRAQARRAPPARRTPCFHGGEQYVAGSSLAEMVAAAGLRTRSFS